MGQKSAENGAIVRCGGCGGRFRAGAGLAGTRQPAQNAGAELTIPASAPTPPRRRRRGIRLSALRVASARHGLSRGRGTSARTSSVPIAGRLTDVPPPPKPRTRKTPPALEDDEQLDVWPRRIPADHSELRAAQLPQISFECSLCDTRLTASADQVGEAFTCPDCGAKTLVPELPTHPPPIVDPVAVAGAYDLDETSAPGPSPEVIFPTRHERVYETGGEAGRGASLGRPDDTPSSRDVPPKWPLISGVFTFPFQGGAMVREVFLAGWLVVLTWLLVIAMSNIMAGYAAFIGVFFLAVVTIGSIIWFASASANWIQIVNETSEGNDRIMGWPDAVFLDWMFDGFFVVMAAAVAGIPASVLARFSGLPEVPLWSERRRSIRSGFSADSAVDARGEFAVGHPVAEGRSAVLSAAPSRGFLSTCCRQSSSRRSFFAASGHLVWVVGRWSSPRQSSWPEHSSISGCSGGLAGASRDRKERSDRYNLSAPITIPACVTPFAQSSGARRLPNLSTTGFPACLRTTGFPACLRTMSLPPAAYESFPACLRTPSLPACWRNRAEAS